MTDALQPECSEAERHRKFVTEALAPVIIPRH